METFTLGILFNYCVLECTFHHVKQCLCTDDIFTLRHKLQLWTQSEGLYECLFIYQQWSLEGQDDPVGT